MSKYLAFSLMVVALIVGIIGGFAVAPKVASPAATPAMTEKQSNEKGIYTDQEFLADMIAHHQDAITMSRRVLEHTSRKEVRDMATSIIEAQSKEIAIMNNWLVQWQ